ncbi:MAG: leucine-rich repeat protein [Tenericutes bacterium]|nr:leucine-rich repeat protein [Mycoplasmatota bacterium]
MRGYRDEKNTNNIYTYIYLNSETNITLKRYPPNKAGKTFDVPETTSIIGKFAFGFNKHLSSVDLAQITYIADFAFELSEALVLQDIPNTVERIGHNSIMDSEIFTLVLRRSHIVDGSATILEGELATQEMQFLVIYIPDESYSNYFQQDRWIRYSYAVEKLSKYAE